MNSLNSLGLKVAGLTLGALLIVFGAYWGIRAAFFGPAEPAKVAQETAPAPLADTDGDGVSDLDEIERGTNPTVAGAGDDNVLPTGDEVGADGQVAGAQTYTRRYLATLPADASREDILDQARLEAFVAVNKGELLPTLPDGTVKTTTDAGAAAIATYLDTISSTHNKQLHPITNEDIEAGFTAQLQLNRDPLNTIVTQLEQNVKVLKTIPAPAETAVLHAKLIAATQALHANVVTVRDMDQDFVGGLIATQNIDDLGQVFQEIATSVKELETKYGLE